MPDMRIINKNRGVDMANDQSLAQESQLKEKKLKLPITSVQVVMLCIQAALVLM